MLTAVTENMCKLVLVFSLYLRGFRTLRNPTVRAWVRLTRLVVHVCERSKAAIYETNDLDKS